MKVKTPLKFDETIFNRVKKDKKWRFAALDDDGKAHFFTEKPYKAICRYCVSGNFPDDQQKKRTIRGKFYTRCNRLLERTDTVDESNERAEKFYKKLKATDWINEKAKVVEIEIKAKIFMPVNDWNCIKGDYESEELALDAIAEDVRSNLDYAGSTVKAISIQQKEIDFAEIQNLPVEYNYFDDGTTDSFSED